MNKYFLMVVSRFNVGFISRRERRVKRVHRDYLATKGNKNYETF